MDERDFWIAKYNADRAHELELDKLAGWYEVAFLQAAFFLNGGAAAAFISFLGGRSDAIPTPLKLLMFLGVALWVMGTVLALRSGDYAYRAQQRFVRYYRLTRRALGIHILQRNEPMLLGNGEGDTVASISADANEDLTVGNERLRASELRGRWSINCFVLGAIYTGLAVFFLP